MKITVTEDSAGNKLYLIFHNTSNENTTFKEFSEQSVSLFGEILSYFLAEVFLTHLKESLNQTTI